MRTDAEDFLDAMITAGMANDQGGDVECAATGYYAVVYIHDDDNMRREQEAGAGMPVPDTLKRATYYVVVTDSLGFIHYAPACCRHSAAADFAEFEAEYAAWEERRPV